MANAASQPTDTGRDFYQRELEDFLPDRLFDAHVHLSPPEVIAPFSSA